MPGIQIDFKSTEQSHRSANPWTVSIVRRTKPDMWIRSPKTTMCDRYSGGSAYICFLVFTPLHLSTRISRLPVLTDTVTGAGWQSGLAWVLPCSLGDFSWPFSARCSRDSRLSCSSADVTSSPSWSSTTPESSSEDCWLLLLLACLECSMPRFGAKRWTILGSGGLGLIFWSGKWQGRTLECLGLGLGLGVTDLQSDYVLAWMRIESLSARIRGWPGIELLSSYHSFLLSCFFFRLLASRWSDAVKVLIKCYDI